MAEINLAAKRYAQAAFDIAVEADSTETWRAAIDQIAQLANIAWPIIRLQGGERVDRQLAWLHTGILGRP